MLHIKTRIAIISLLFIILIAIHFQINPIRLIKATHDSFTIDQTDADEKWIGMSLSEYKEIDKNLSEQIKLPHEKCIGSFI